MYRITFEMTNKCNMNCTYCYLDHYEEPLSLGIALKAIDIFENEKVINDELFVSYIGGEPLLYKENLIKITNQIKGRLKELNKNISFGITTNAVLLDERIINFFIENNFTVKISLDGNKKFHDRNRKMLSGESSYEKILSNIKLLKIFEEKTKLFVQISMVINKNTYKFVFENFKHICELGFRFICPCLETYSNWTTDELEEIENQYKKIVRYIVMKAAKEKEFIYFKIIVLAHNRRDKKYECLYCFPGRNGIHVKVNGDIYACYACQKDYFKIGDVYHGFDKEKYENHRMYSNEYDTQCLGCSYFKICAAKDCTAVNYELTGNPKKVPYHYCELEKIEHRLLGYFEQIKRDVLLEGKNYEE